jgi:hypothetical protein
VRQSLRVGARRKIMLASLSLCHRCRVLSGTTNMQIPNEDQESLDMHSGNFQHVSFPFRPSRKLMHSPRRDPAPPFIGLIISPPQSAINISPLSHFPSLLPLAPLRSSSTTRRGRAYNGGRCHHHHSPSPHTSPVVGGRLLIRKSNLPHG